MKILYSCLSKSWGGMEMVTISSIKKLLEKGISVELLCAAESRIHIEANNLGMIIYPVKAPGYLHPFLTLKMISILKNGRCDLIHTHSSKDLWLLVPALKAGRIKMPLILTKHVGSFINKRDKFHNWLYSRVNYAIAISNVIKRNLIDTTCLDEKKIFLHYNGVDTCRFNPDNIDPKIARSEFDISDSEILLGMVARYSAGKGHELFIKAARNLSGKYDNLKFIMIGEASKGEDKYADTIKQLAKDNNLNNLLFAGYRSDIPEMLSALDIFVFPSQAEAFGVALLEAMAMAKPSVSTNSDGVLDITVDNETGFLFEKNNAGDLVDKLEILINSPEKRKEFGIAARERVIQCFNSESQMNKLINIYTRITKK